MSNLILTRSVGQRIIIHNENKEPSYIYIQVCGIRGNQARLSINAPIEYNIDREEIYVRKKINPKKKGV